MRYVILHLILVMVAPRLSAQSVVLVTDSILQSGKFDITSYCTYWEDSSGGKIHFPAVTTQSFQSQNSILKSISPSPRHSKSVIWIRLKLSNRSHSDSTIVQLDIGRQGEQVLFDVAGFALQQTGVYFYPYNKDQWKSLTISLPRNDTATYFIRITNKLRAATAPAVILYNDTALRNMLANHSSSQIRESWFMFLIAGLIFMMCLFGFTQYLYTSKNYFLFYSMFCLLGCATQVWNTNYYFSVGLPLPMKSANQLFAYGISVFYAFFINSIADLQNKQPGLWRLLKILIAVIGIQALISVYEYFFDLAFDGMLYYNHKSDVIILISVVIFYGLFKSNTNIRYYLLSGAGFVMVSHIIVSSGLIAKIDNPDFRNIVVYLTGGAGIFLENFLFLLGMAYQHQQIARDHLEIQKNYARSLESALAVKSLEIEEAGRQLRKQELSELEHLYRARLAETEMAALRAQMNPHFMFNCINSIDSLIYSNDKYNATLYLNKFARLLRNILESSKEKTVSVEQEIETLKLYIEMEELRHQHTFRALFTISEDVMDGSYRVPPLIIQPFVENAILHGLKNLNGKEGLLQIDISTSANFLEYTITDNGIGREAASALRQIKTTSYGMQMSSERIRLFNEEDKSAIDIEDLFDEDDLAAGTRVKVKLKIKQALVRAGNQP